MSLIDFENIFEIIKDYIFHIIDSAIDPYLVKSRIMAHAHSFHKVSKNVRCGETKERLANPNNPYKIIF